MIIASFFGLWLVVLFFFLIYVEISFVYGTCEGGLTRLLVYGILSSVNVLLTTTLITTTKALFDLLRNGFQSFCKYLGVFCPIVCHLTLFRFELQTLIT